MEFIIIKKISAKDVIKHYCKKIFLRKEALIIGIVLFILIFTFKFFSITATTSKDFRRKWLLETDPILQKIMADNLIHLPKLSDFIHPYRKFFHLYRLPKKLKKAYYSEMTSANPDTAHPLAPDFSFHLNYYRKKVRIFHDTNCGCIYRIYVLPPFSSYLTKIDSLTAKNFKNLTLEITLDGLTTSYSLTQILENEKAPFLSPLGSKNLRPLSGVGSYMPFCYGQSADIHYVDDNEYPDNLLNITVDCVSNELKCPIKQYAAISYIKSSSVFNQNLNFRDVNGENLESLPYLAKYLDKPEFYGPHSDTGCNLICEHFNIGSRKLKILERRNKPGVIVSILLSGLNEAVNGRNTRENDVRIFENWNKIFLSVYADGIEKPQIYVPLGTLFVLRGSTNDFVSSAYGRSRRYCNYLRNSTVHSSYMTVAYFFLPIPYWHDVKILLEYENATPPSNKQICFQVLETENFYDERKTGYLHGNVVFHSGQTDKWREVLSLNGGWGHLVSLAIEINNLKPNLKDSLIKRWAALQADPVIYIDNSKFPRIRGTGLEDYFSFSHGFAGAENSSFAFVGVPYGYENRTSTGKSWSCYRHHILDPVMFDDSLQFVMEGTDENNFFKPAEKLAFDEYRKLESRYETSFVYLTFYYFKKHSNNSHTKHICDEIRFCDNASLASHNFKSSTVPSIFKYNLLRYLGDSKHNFAEKDICGFSYANQSEIEFRLKVPTSGNTKIVFTRKYHANPFQWNDKCLLNYNGFTREWLMAMGPTNGEYSLREEFIILTADEDNVSRDFDNFEFKLTVSSEWRDISYTLCSVLE